MEGFLSLLDALQRRCLDSLLGFCCRIFPCFPNSLFGNMQRCIVFAFLLSDLLHDDGTSFRRGGEVYNTRRGLLADFKVLAESV
jgi:hypothetical protein